MKDDFAPWWPREGEAPIERFPLPVQALAWLVAFAFGGYFWYAVISGCF